MADGVVEIDVELDSSKAEQSGSKLAGNLAKAGAAAAAALGAATGALAKQALDAYAQYEQLAGGIETLFKDSASVVQEYANNAYSTAGVSANEYMQIVTGFSGALLRSLAGDAEEAARLSDVAVRDMADQVNKYGTSMQMVQDTYLSLARGNTQTLDNLFGGMFAGTKQGLEDMLEYAEQYRSSIGETVSYSADSYADIVQAINDVSMSLGVAGATAEEAATTIEGSVNAAKAAWQNWVTGLGNDGADMQKLTQQLVDSVVAAARNVVPRLGTIITSLMAALVTSIPQALSDIGGQILPMLEDVANMMLEALPSFIASGVSMVGGLATGILNAIPNLFATASQSLLAQGVPQLITTLVSLALRIVQALPTVVSNLTAAIPQVIGGIVTAVTEGVPLLVRGFIVLFNAFMEALPQIIANLIEALPQIIDSVIDTLATFAPMLLSAAFQLFQSILKGLVENGPAILEQASLLLGHLLAKFTELPGKLFEIGANIVRGLWDGIQSLAGWIWEKISGWAGSLVESAMDALGIHSPSTVMADKVGRNMALGVPAGFEKVDVGKDIERSLLSDVTSIGMSARLSVAGGTTTNYFTIERIDAHDMQGIDNVNALVRLFEMNA